MIKIIIMGWSKNLLINYKCFLKKLAKINTTYEQETQRTCTGYPQNEILKNKAIKYLGS